MKVRANNTEPREALLIEVQILHGVRSLRSNIAPSTFVERGPLPDGGSK